MDVSDVPDLEIITLLTLPPELVQHVLLWTDMSFDGHGDGSITLPSIAATCHAFRAMLLSLPAMPLRLAGLRRSSVSATHHVSGRTRLSLPLSVEWEHMLGSHRPKSSPLHPLCLDLYQCDVDAEALKAGMMTPLRGLSLRKCLSVTPHKLSNLFFNNSPTRTLSTLILSSLSLSDRTMWAMCGLKQLRVLCLAECAVHVDALRIATLPRLQELRCLMLCGTNLHRSFEQSNPTGLMAEGVAGMSLYADANQQPHTDGIFSLNGMVAPPTLANTVGIHEGGKTLQDPTSKLPLGSIPAYILPKLSLIELTFVHASDREAFLALAPHAQTLDLCAAAPALDAGLTSLRSVLSDACGEGGGCLVDSALQAALSARCSGFHETALHHAAIDGNAAAAKVLLEHGAPADVKDAKGCTPLSRAIFWGRAAVVALLLETKACDLNQCNHAAESPAYLAALRGHPECLQLLLDAQAPDAPAKCTYHDGYTPLHAAVISRSVKCLRMLLDAGFDPSAQNKYGQTVLHIAASLGGLSLEGVELLLAGGADATLKDERGQTAQRVAQAKGHELVARVLAAHEATRLEVSLWPTQPRSPRASATEAEEEQPPVTAGRGRGRRRRGRGRGRQQAPEAEAEGAAQFNPNAPIPVGWSTNGNVFYEA